MGDMGPPGATLPGERGEKGIPGPVGQCNTFFSDFLWNSFSIGIPGPQGLPGLKGEPGNKKTWKSFQNYNFFSVNVQVDQDHQVPHHFPAHKVKKVIVELQASQAVQDFQ